MGALLQDLLLARSSVQRHAERRTDEIWIAEQRERARILLVSDGQMAVDAGLLELPAGEIPATVQLSFLGVDADHIPIFCAHVTEVDPTVRWSGLREIGSLLDERQSGLAVAAVALDHWHRTHQHCTRCGAVTHVTEAGWSRVCPVDGTRHFPRTDPAIIVLVIDRADRALLGRQVRWQPAWFSTLAGFVEPGESAEQAVRREVHEEAGVTVDAVDYLGSQPWPFPGSLMLGYHAWATSDAVHVDGREIAEARWFSRDGLVAACETGQVQLPPAISIARRLVERWFGGPLPGQWSRP
jgi:NAD+ diphosphatase